MPRVLWLLIPAGVLVWAAAFLVGGERAPQPIPAAAAEPEPLAAPVERAPSPARSAEPAGPPPPPEAPPPVAVVGAPPQVTAPSGVLASAAASWRAARDSLLGRHADGPPAPPPPPAPDQVATGELGEGFLSPEYAALERAYVYEPRDGAWAGQQEEQLRGTLNASSLSKQLSIVNCQQTICRVVFERVPPDAFDQLVQVPGFAQLSGVGSGTPYSYRSGQLSVYFTRRSAIVPE